eukprot:scaffold175753_cov63-Attheya_sp.AAC.4
MTALDEDDNVLPLRSTKSPSRRGIHKSKYHIRAAFRCISFLALLSVYGGYHKFYASPVSSQVQNYTNEPSSIETTYVLTDGVSLDTGSMTSQLIGGTSSLPETNGRRLEGGLGLCSDMTKADPEWMLVFYIIGVLYMFLALAIVCDEFFVPALEEMSSDRHLNLSMDVAGATLMAAGGSAPELFTSLFGTFTESAIGFGTIVGSAVFNVLFVIGMCSLLSKELLTLTWWPLFRDTLYYSTGLVTLAIFVGVISPGEIELWEGIVLFVMYFGYILVMYYNRKLYTAITGKQLNMPGSSALASVVSTSGGQPLSTRNLDRTGSVSSIVTTEMGPVSFRWPGTFRAGVLKLLRDPDSWIDTAGVGIVAKLAGDVDYVFKQVDINGDNEIDRDELFKLFEKLDCRVAPEELDAVFRELDADKDGTVRESTSKSLLLL